MRKLLSHPVVMLFSIVVVGLIIVSLQFSKDQVSRRAAIVASQEESLEKIQTEVAELEARLEQSSDPFYQEKVLRDELLLQKDGEIVIQIPREQLPEIVRPSATPTQTPWESWRQIL